MMKGRCIHAVSVTDASGAAIQHLKYMAFGEVFVDQRRTGFGTPYKFNAKELDCESGYYYYSARYYDPRMARFLSVDPLASDMPAWGSYTYTFDNPIRLVDPTGMRPEEPDWEPKVDSEGNITYVSEDGDSYKTFVEQYGEDAARSVFESNCEGCFDKGAVYSEGEIALNSTEPLKLIIDNKKPEGGYILDMLFGGDGKGTITDIQDISNQLTLITELGKDWSIDDFFMSRDGGNTPSFKTSGSLMVDGHAYSNGFVNFDRALVQPGKKFPASPTRGMTIDGFKRDYHAGKNAPALKFTYFNLK